VGGRSCVLFKPDLLFFDETRDECAFLEK
jgi:hypothetical protein